MTEQLQTFTDNMLTKSSHKSIEEMKTHIWAKLAKKNLNFTINKMYVYKTHARSIVFYAVDAFLKFGFKAMREQIIQE